MHAEKCYRENNKQLVAYWFSVPFPKIAEKNLAIYRTINTGFTWIDGLFKWPRFEVVCLGSCPKTIILALINLKASITTCKNKMSSQFFLENATNSAKQQWTRHNQLSSVFGPYPENHLIIILIKKSLLLAMLSAHYTTLYCKVTPIITFSMEL